MGLALPAFRLATPPFEDVQVAVIDEIAAPLLANVPKDTRSEPDETRATEGFGGGAGVPTIALFDDDDAGPAPRLFVAVTVHW
jgi:hypothetical protein